MPAPALPWERADRRGSGAREENTAALATAATAAAATSGERHRGRGANAEVGFRVAVAAAAVAAGEEGATRGVVGARQDAVRRLLRAIGGGSEENDEADRKTGVVPLWGPDEV